MSNYTTTVLRASRAFHKLWSYFKNRPTETQQWGWVALQSQKEFYSRTNKSRNGEEKLHCATACEKKVGDLKFSITQNRNTTKIIHLKHVHNHSKSLAARACNKRYVTQKLIIYSLYIKIIIGRHIKAFVIKLPVQVVCKQYILHTQKSHINTSGTSSLVKIRQLVL